MKTKSFILIILLSLPLGAQCLDKGAVTSGTFNIHLDNDVFLCSFLDRYYSSGVKLTWISPVIKNYKAVPILKSLPFVNKPGFTHALSISLGHDIFIPTKITTSELLEDDHPYAGMLFFEFGIHSKSQDRMANLEIDLGIIGPAAYAREIQTAVHKFLHSDLPEGWQHQLKNELAFGVMYERKWRVFFFSY